MQQGRLRVTKVEMAGLGAGLFLNRVVKMDFLEKA